MYFASRATTPASANFVYAILAVSFARFRAPLERSSASPLTPHPEPPRSLIKKAVSVRKHLERSRKDKDAKFRLILIESRVHRLARYYKRVGQLPPNWKYDSATASTLV
jgi:small subunit ribosomal protein S13e